MGEHLPCKQGVKSSNLSISIARELDEHERKRSLSLQIDQTENLVNTSEAKYEPSYRHVNALNECKRKRSMSLVVDLAEDKLFSAIVP